MLQVVASIKLLHSRSPRDGFDLLLLKPSSFFPTRLKGGVASWQFSIEITGFCRALDSSNGICSWIMPLPAGLKFWDPTVILGPAACRAKPWWWPKLLPRSVQRWCTSMWTWRSATQKWPTHFCSRTRDLFGIWTCFNYLHKNVDPQSLGFGRNPLSVPSPDMDCKLPFLFDLEVWTSNLSWWNPKRGRPNFLFSSRIPSNHWFWCCFRFSKKMA